jgi:phosphoribosylaminoimidazole carboxylase (NCAIR synthetase)
MLEELKIGIIGTGAEGCQLLQQANEWKLDITLLTPTPPAKASIAYELGDPQIAHDLIAFGKECTHLLVLDPHVHRGALKSLQQMGIKVNPGTETLDWMADPQKLSKALKVHSIPIATEWLSAASALDHTTSHSVHKATAIAQLAGAQASSPGNGTSHSYTAQLSGSTESFNGFAKEAGTVEVLLSRWTDGWVECYNPVMMLMQAERMLADFRMRTPGIHSKTAINACQLAAKVAGALELNGLINIVLQYNDLDQLSFKAIRVLPETHNGFSDSGNPRSAYEQERRALLGLPAGSSFSNVVRNNSKILEPAAHRRYAQEVALKLILGLHHPAPDSKAAAAMAQSRTRKNLADIDMEDFISKTLMVRHLLSSAS